MKAFVNTLSLDTHIHTYLTITKPSINLVTAPSNLHPLNTPLSISFSHTLSIHSSIHPLNTPSQYTLSIHPLNTPLNTSLNTYPPPSPQLNKLRTAKTLAPGQGLDPGGAVSGHRPPSGVGVGGSRSILAFAVPMARPSGGGAGGGGGTARGGCHGNSNSGGGGGGGVMSKGKGPSNGKPPAARAAAAAAAAAATAMTMTRPPTSHRSSDSGPTSSSSSSSCALLTARKLSGGCAMVHEVEETPLEKMRARSKPQGLAAAAGNNAYSLDRTFTF